ncbi:unnamed protein product, partial [Phaeothamnion confervicola]
GGGGGTGGGATSGTSNDSGAASSGGASNNGRGKSFWAEEPGFPLVSHVLQDEIQLLPETAGTAEAAGATSPLGVDADSGVSAAMVAVAASAVGGDSRGAGCHGGAAATAPLPPWPIAPHGAAVGSEVRDAVKAQAADARTSNSSSSGGTSSGSLTQRRAPSFLPDSSSIADVLSGSMDADRLASNGIGGSDGDDSGCRARHAAEAALLSAVGDAAVEAVYAAL